MIWDKKMTKDTPLKTSLAFFYAYGRHHKVNPNTVSVGARCSMGALESQYQRIIYNAVLFGVERGLQRLLRDKNSLLYLSLNMNKFTSSLSLRTHLYKVQILLAIYCEQIGDLPNCHQRYSI